MAVDMEAPPDDRGGQLLDMAAGEVAWPIAVGAIAVGELDVGAMQPQLETSPPPGDGIKKAPRARLGKDIGDLVVAQPVKEPQGNYEIGSKRLQIRDAFGGKRDARIAPAVGLPGVADRRLGNVDAEVARSTVLDKPCCKQAGPAAELDHTLAGQEGFQQLRRNRKSMA